MIRPNFIASCWNQPVVGFPMLILTKKLQIIKGKLKIWNKETFGDIHLLVKNSTTHLESIQHQIHLEGLTDSLRLSIIHARHDLDQALAKEEIYWMEKFKLNWHVKGDRNTSYFHIISKIKGSRNKISMLRDGEKTITDPSFLDDHAANYFSNLFGFARTFVTPGLIEVIPCLVDDQMNHILTMTPIVKEIE